MVEARALQPPQPAANERRERDVEVLIEPVGGKLVDIDQTALLLYEVAAE